MRILRASYIRAIALVVSVGASVSAQPNGYDGWQIVSVSISGETELQTLLKLDDGSRGLQIWSDRLGIGEVNVRVAPGRATALMRAGLRYRVVVEDVQTYLDNLLQARELGDSCGYWTYDNVVGHLFELASNSPIAEVVSIGTSVQGRALWVVRITGPGAGKPGVLYHGAQHGGEYVGTSTILRLAEYLLGNYGVQPEATALVDSVELYLLPVMNPDGYVTFDRYNAHDVDLNRNWDGPTGTTGDSGGPWPFCEPETAAIRDFLTEHQNVKVHVDLHGFAQVIMWPWGHTAGKCLDHATFTRLGIAMQERISSAGGATFGIGPIYTVAYPIVGGSIDYSYAWNRLWSFVFELEDCQEALPALLYLAAWISDCNRNGVADATDVANGSSSDCNDNTVPDECEYQGDCNDDGEPDICSLCVEGNDCNANGIPDYCDVEEGASPDCNANLVPDECEPDCNHNGVADACDISTGSSSDCDHNHIPDECQSDCDFDGTADACELLAGAADCDGNRVPDHCQPDCNGNGVADVCDLAIGTEQDNNGNGVPDVCEVAWFVDDDAVPGGDGRTWATAFNDLQSALTIADRGDVIRVAAGVYRPDRGLRDREATFHLVSGVQLIGGYAGLGSPNPDARDCQRFESRLSGDLNADDPDTPGYSDCCVPHDGPGCGDPVCSDTVCGNFPECCAARWDETCAYWANRYTLCRILCFTTGENALHVVTASGVDAAAVVDGFTICNGNTNLTPEFRGSGGGIYNDGGSPKIRNCIVRDNIAGGGMWNSGGDPMIDNSAFVRNSGFGIFSGQSEVTIIGTEFSDGEGTAVVNVDSTATLDKCVFRRNVALWDSGALKNENSTVRVRNCQFLNNVSVYQQSRGGAMLNRWGTVIITDSLFSGNAADDDAGAIYNGYLTNVTLSGCTFTANVTGRRGGAIVSFDSMPIVSNCIFWHNEDEGGQNEASQIFFEDSDGIYVAAITYSTVQGWSGVWGGAGNFGGDPLFVDPLGADGVAGTGDEDLRLLSGSPCINAGDPQFEPPPEALSLDGHARLLCGQVDMGAYESGIGDYDCSGAVDLLDFAGWSRCATGPSLSIYSPGCEVFDFEKDGDVDLSDFAAFQNVFGH